MNEFMCKLIRYIDIPHSFELILQGKKNTVYLFYLALHKSIERIIMSVNGIGCAAHTMCVDIVA